MKDLTLMALHEIKAWNAADIRGFDEITPDMEMLKARRKVINGAIAQHTRRNSGKQGG